jgi:hypothetical protein
MRLRAGEFERATLWSSADAASFRQMLVAAAQLPEQNAGHLLVTLHEQLRAIDLQLTVCGLNITATKCSKLLAGVLGNASVTATDAII